MAKAVSPCDILRSLSLIATAIFTGLTSTASAQTILFTENFDDTSFAARGWYDIARTGGTIDAANHSPGSSASLDLHFDLGGTTPTAGYPGRVLFTASPTVYMSFWMKLGSAAVTWQGSGKPYHPHLFRLFSDADDPFVGPNTCHLSVLVEVSLFTPRIAALDSLDININFLGVDLLTSATPHALMGGNGNQNATATYYADPTPPNYANGTFWDAASPAYVNNQWHHVEFFVAMNSTSGGIANPDGVFKHWIDGNLVVNYTNVYLRTGGNPNRKFNQLALLPYMGDGSPIAQDLWIDNLIVADQRISSAPPAPKNLRVIQ